MEVKGETERQGRSRSSTGTGSGGRAGGTPIEQE